MPNIMHCRGDLGDFINADHVAKVRNGKKGSICLTLANGEVVTVNGGDAYDMAQSMCPIVSDAGSKIILLMVTDDGNPARIIRSPIIAWRITSWGSQPIPVGLFDDQSDDYALLLPSGEVRGVENFDTYDNEEDYLSGIIAERERRSLRDRDSAEVQD